MFNKTNKMYNKLIVGFVLLSFLLSIPPVMAEGNGNEVERVSVIVGFERTPDVGIVTTYGGEIKCTYDSISAVAANIPVKAISALEKNPKVAYIEYDVTVNMLSEELPWGVDRIDADQAWDASTGTGVKVAVIDTGIDKDHPDLASNIKGGVNYVPSGIKVNPDKWDDDNGHGTHCAGIIAAVDNTEGVIGVAKETDLYGVKVLDRRGSGYLSDVIAGIQWAIDNDMDVISMSLGSGSDSQSLEDACDSAWDAGIVVVASAGNEGDGDISTNEYSYPAAYSSVIAVAATDSTDAVPDWSNSGSYVELAAPGESIYSTYKGGVYATMSGTSMACPHVAGTAALVIASDSSLTNAEVRQQLIDTAEDLGATGKDNLYGYGLVDAEEAVGPAEADTTPPIISDLAVYGITESSATITWTTDEASDNTVNYGTTTALGSTASSAEMITSHSITLTGLSAETTYYFEVQSADTSGNTATDDNGGVYHTFTTAVPDTTPPVISSVAVTDITDSSATITWTTDEASDSEVNYGTTTLLGSPASHAEMVTSHSVTLTGLSEETTYYFEVQSTDASENTATDNNGGAYYTFTTTSAPDYDVHVSSIDMWYTTAGRNVKIYSKITIVDSNGIAVEGATVSLEMTLPNDGGTAIASAITGSDGTVTFLYGPTKVKGTYTSTVTDVAKDGWTYDPTANLETSDSLTVI